MCDPPGQHAETFYLLRIDHLFLHALAVGDVARNLRSAYDVARGVANGRDADVDSDLGAVLSTAHRFVMADVLAALDALDDFETVVAATLRGQGSDVRSDHLLSGVAEDPRCCLVPACDGAIRAFPDDGILGRLHNRSHVKMYFLGFLRRCEIAKHEHYPDHVARLVADRGRAIADGYHPSIFRREYGILCQRPNVAFPQNYRGRILYCRSGELVGNGKHHMERLPDSFSIPARDCPGCGIDER